MSVCLSLGVCLMSPKVQERFFETWIKSSLYHDSIQNSHFNDLYIKQQKNE